MTPEELKALPKPKLLAQMMLDWYSEASALDWYKKYGGADNPREIDPVRVMKHLCREILAAPDASEEMAALKNQLANMTLSRDEARQVTRNLQKKFNETKYAYDDASEEIATLKKRIIDLEQQLAESRKAVGDEEVDESANRLHLYGKFMADSIGHALLLKDIETLIRAARQRGRVGGDAVNLAEMVKNYPGYGLSGKSIREWHDECVSLANAISQAANPQPKEKPGPTCKEYANALGHDQAKAMGIPLSDEPFAEWEKRSKPAAKPEPIPTALSGDDCECRTWASDDIRRRMWGNGHHEKCPKHQPMVGMSDLLSDICQGIENWGGEEDGIYPGIWEAYKKVKFFVSGKVITDDGTPAKPEPVATAQAQGEHGDALTPEDRKTVEDIRAKIREGSWSWVLMKIIDKHFPKPPEPKMSAKEAKECIAQIKGCVKLVGSDADHAALNRLEELMGGAK